MEDWLKFSVCFWHTFRGNGSDPFGVGTFNKDSLLRVEKNSDPMDVAKERLKIAFEFFVKLGVKYWTFHDRDIAPEGKTVEESNNILIEIAKLAKELQDKTGIKLLWGTANLFSDPMYMNGASTNPDIHVFLKAGAQVKCAMDVTHYLGDENFVFCPILGFSSRTREGGREGFNSYLNTDFKLELDNMAKFLWMAVDYKIKIGFKGQLLIEPKPKEPTAHQYDYDAQTVIGFLKIYELDKYFKLNIEPNHTTLAGHNYIHDIQMASIFGFLGSVDCNSGDQSLGWDTDQFPMDIKNATMLMKIIMEQGGLRSGGLNFDCKIRRESIDPEDLFIGHIGAMDTMAKGLLIAEKIINDKVLDNMKKKRYENSIDKCKWNDPKVTLTFDDCFATICKNGEPKKNISAKQEAFEVVFNSYF